MHRSHIPTCRAFRMVWCGFDPKMESGLVEYADGVASAIKAKARQTGRSLTAQIAVEHDQLFILTQNLKEQRELLLPGSYERKRCDAFLGLAAFTSHLIPKTEDVSAESFDEDLRRCASDIADCISSFDSDYEAQLPSLSFVERIISSVNSFIQRGRNSLPKSSQSRLRSNSAR